MKKALCSYYGDPDAFFPGPGQTFRANSAKKICLNCPVTKECKDFKQRTGTTDGIWGGESNSRKKHNR
jgi:WhiB family transcriptional regulator, redox-sensing transcriptional regulator